MKIRLVYITIIYIFISHSLSAQFLQNCNIVGSDILDPTNASQKEISCETLNSSPLTITVGQQVGSGAFGKVFSGFATSSDDQLVNTPIAIKQIKLDATGPVDGYERIDDSTEKTSPMTDVENEFRTLIQMSRDKNLSKIVIKPYAFFKDNNYAYIIMEYGGVALDSYFRAHKGNFESAYINIAKQLKNALVALKNAGIVHMDLHPKNILVNNKNKIKLIDFGLSKGHGQPVSITGHGLYRDPNIFAMKKAYYNYDEYSVAIILDELLEGRSFMASAVPHEEQKIATTQADYYQKLLSNYTDRLKTCVNSSTCLKTKYLLLLSLNPDISDRQPISSYLDTLK